MEAKISNEKIITNIGITDLDEVVSSVYDFGKAYTIWLFEAEMGAGKTTFIKSLCSSLGVKDHVSSPTFSLVNEYETEQRSVIYHFDFYRIEEEVEALEIGVEDYFYSGNLCLIEWPQLIPSFIPDTYLSIKISVQSHTGNRDITIQKHGKGNIS